MSNLYVSQPIDIELTCSVEAPGSMSSAVSASIAYQKPNGTSGSWVADVNTGTGVVSYSATASDIGMAGNWVLQPVVTFAGDRTIPGSSVPMTINKRFE
jgi:hypothetical protein